MMHLVVLLFCHLSYIQLGKFDSTIPKPKPHLTLTCFIKLLAYIPFNVGLQLTYFQNLTKLIRDLLLFCYIIGQYYTFDYDLIYRLLGFEFFAIFALPLILEGWMAHSPNYILYLLKYYSLYIPLFVNQFLLHEDRMIQTIFFFSIIEIPSMAHKRQDRDQPEIKMNSYIFKLVQLPNAKIAILHCTKRQTNDTNQIELAIACIRNKTRKLVENEQNISDLYNQYSKKQQNGIESFDEWVIIRRIAVSANTSELNYIPKKNMLVISSCSDLKIYNANNLLLLKVINFSRSLKRLSFINQDQYYSFLKKVGNSQTMISINDSIFNTIASQHVVPQDIQPEIIKFIKYPCSFNKKVDKYVYMCVPSDRLNCLIIVEVKEQQRKRFLSSSNNFEKFLTKSNQGINFTDQNQEVSLEQKLSSVLDIKDLEGEEKLKDFDLIMDDNDEEEEEVEIDTEFNQDFNENITELENENILIGNNGKKYIKRRKNKKGELNKDSFIQEINLYEHISKNKSIKQTKSTDNQINEYIIDCSAIKDILVHEHLLVISCSENIVFFDLQLRRVVKKISTLNFDTRVHWIRITPQYTYYLISNEIRTWIARQSNKINDFTIIQHFNFYDIQYILESKCKNQLFVIYNNTLYKQKIAVIDLSIYC